MILKSFALYLNIQYGSVRDDVIRDVTFAVGCFDITSAFERISCKSWFHLSSQFSKLSFNLRTFEFISADMLYFYPLSYVIKLNHLSYVLNSTVFICRQANPFTHRAGPYEIINSCKQAVLAFPSDDVTVFEGIIVEP